MARSFASVLAIIGLLLAGCGGTQLNELVPKLVVKQGTPTDSNGHYLLDFGDVPLTASSTLPLTIENQGRITLILQPIALIPPFSSDAMEVQHVAAEGSLDIAFTFSPTMEGPFTATAMLTSNGGHATVVLKGNGVKVPVCSFTVSPTTVNFGNLAVGQTQKSTVTVTNTGSSDCEVSQLSLSSATPPAFTFSAPSIPDTVSAGDKLAISVEFAPTAPGVFQGDLLLTVGTHGTNGTSGKVLLMGSASQPMPMCSFVVSPLALSFGNVAVGASKLGSFTITNTGRDDCALSALALSPTSDPSFSLSAPPPLPATIAGGGHLGVEVAFSPSHSAANFGGAVDMVVGGNPATVTLSGASPANCTITMPTGNCTVPASADIYLNDTSTLYAFDTGAMTYKTVGSFSGGPGFFTMYDIAIDSKGVMVGVSNGTLYYIDPTTAACTQLAVGPDSSANGLTFSPDGRLFVAGAEIDVFDRTTGQFTTLVPAGQYQTSGDIVGLPDGMLYWTVQGSNTDLLLKVDPNSGAITTLGDTGYSVIWGLSYANNVLYGFTDSGQALEINTQNAQSTATNVGGSWYGAATNPATWP